MSDEATFNFLCWALAIVCFLGGFVFGMDYEHWRRLRWNKQQSKQANPPLPKGGSSTGRRADKMRAAIREYDDRVAEFAPAAVSNAQSLSQHERLPEALTTALAPPAPSAHCCCGKWPCDISSPLRF